MPLLPKSLLPTRIPSPTRGPTTTTQARDHNKLRTNILNVAEVLSGGVAGCTAELVSIPLDTLKVKAQTTSKIPALNSSSLNSTNLQISKIIQNTYKNGGFRAFFGGRVCLTAAFQRQMIMASVKFGCYDLVKNEYCKVFDVSEDARFTPKYVKILAASTTGILAVLIGQPTDVVKVRTQAKLDTYKSTIQAYKEIHQSEGVKKGLWRGTFPGAIRNMAVNTAEIGCYDIIKGVVLRNNLMKDEWPCFIVCSICTGVLATLVSSPADCLKTVYSNSKPGQYKSLWDCCSKLWMDNGVKSFYRGVSFNGSRMIVWNILMFTTLENLKKTIDAAR